MYSRAKSKTAANPASTWSAYFNKAHSNRFSIQLVSVSPALFSPVADVHQDRLFKETDLP